MMSLLLIASAAGLIVVALVLVRRQLDEVRRAQDGARLSIEQGRAESRDLKNELELRSEAASQAASGAASELGEHTHRLVETTQATVENAERAIRAELQTVRAALQAPHIPILLDMDRMSDAEALSFARSLRHVRPLIAYPRWQFASDWENPDLAFQFRRQIWERFRDAPGDMPLQLEWHNGLTLELHLGNDVSVLAYCAGCYEPNEFAFLERFLQPGMNVLDAGANEGLYALFAAAKVGPTGKVWAVEPSDRECRRLKRNIELSSLSNVSVQQVALSDKSGTGSLTVAGDEHSGHNTLGELAYAKTEQLSREEVEVQTLDEFASANGIERIDLVKIDVEGAEERLITGGQSVIERCRPVMLFEASERSLLRQGSSVGRLCHRLRQDRFKIYRFEDSTGLPVSDEDGVYSENLIACPLEKPLPETVFRHELPS